jgi:hypothetical protein
MRSRTCLALLLVLSACATTEVLPEERVAPNPRLANLQRTWGSEALRTRLRFLR